MEVSVLLCDLLMVILIAYCLDPMVTLALWVMSPVARGLSNKLKGRRPSPNMMFIGQILFLPVVHVQCMVNNLGCLLR